MSTYERTLEVKKQMIGGYGRKASKSSFTRRERPSRAGRTTRGSRRYVRGR